MWQEEDIRTHRGTARIQEDGEKRNKKLLLDLIVNNIDIKTKKKKKVLILKPTCQHFFFEGDSEP